jgi:GABA permease
MSRAPTSSHHLRDRHVTMIAMGGIIGAGLFVGSGTVLAQVGPGAFLTYAVTGALILCVMRMLGEMAAARPSVGSFTEYARSARWVTGPVSRWPGCTGISGSSSWGSKPWPAPNAC